MAVRTVVIAEEDLSCRGWVAKVSVACLSSHKEEWSSFYSMLVIVFFDQNLRGRKLMIK
jgi:hypothetical protein